MQAFESISAPMAMPPPASPMHAQCLGPGALAAILQPGTGLAIWDRQPARPCRPAIAAILAGPGFSHVAEGPADAATRQMRAVLPPRAGALLADIASLARLFAAIAGSSAVRLRLEHLDDDSCRLFHVDAVRLRLLCTYAGAGTDWLGRDGRIHRMAAFQVGLFKGSRHPDPGPRTRHRSPPVSRLPQGRRARLLLCIDEAGSLP